MKLGTKMQSPFALMVQGFVFGGILFFSTHDVSAAVPTAPQAASERA